MYTNLSEETISRLSDMIGKAVARELAGGLTVNVKLDAPVVAEAPEVAEQLSVVARFKNWLV